MEIVFEGACRVDRFEELRERLMSGLKLQDGRVTCSMKAVTEADLSFFQLLHAAKKSYATAGVELMMLSYLPAALKARANLAGLPELCAA